MAAAGALFAASASPSEGLAQDAKPPAADAPVGDSVSVPLPAERPPYFAGEVHLEGVFPVLRSSICPSGAACVFGRGPGVGGLFERRWVSGLSLGVGYDLWLLNGNGVYEVTVLQDLAAVVRYHFLGDRMTQPFVSGALGALLLGDSFSVSAGGASVEAVLGVEIQMSASFALVVATAWRLFMTSAFRTPNDGVARAQDRDVNLAATLRLGLAILQ